MAKALWNSMSEVEVLLQANPGAAQPDAILPQGTVIKIPKSRKYTIGPGDTLATIAERLLGDDKENKTIWETNRTALPDPSALEVGAVLEIPLMPVASERLKQLGDVESD